MVRRHGDYDAVLFLAGLAVIAGLNISLHDFQPLQRGFPGAGEFRFHHYRPASGRGKDGRGEGYRYEDDLFSVVSCLGIGAVMAVIAPLFPRMYNTTDEVRRLAEQFIWISAMVMPIQAFMHACYFTLRSGGKTFITFLFDSAFMWVVSIPLAFCLSRFSGLPIVPLYLICQMADIIKGVIGFILVKKRNMDTKLCCGGSIGMRIIFVRHAEPDYANDTLTEKGWRGCASGGARERDGM